MSRFKRFSGAGWFVAGIAAAALLVPTAIGAATVIKYMGIEGQSHSATGGKITSDVQVTTDGQLLTTAASFDDYYVHETLTPINVPIATPPPGKALIVTSVHYSSSGGQPIEQGLVDWIGKGDCVSFTRITVDVVNLDGDAVAVLPFDPGLAIPAGYVLCGLSVPSAGALDFVTVVGYSVPSNTVHRPG